jgi:hypothetical protein
MKDVIDLLQEIADVEHWTCLPHSGASGDELTLPPIITWRFKKPSTELAGFIHSVISTFRGALTWEFSAAKRNWSLMPARIREFARARGYSGTLTAAEELKKTEPEVGIRANADLRLLAAHLQYHLDLARDGTSASAGA